MPVRTGRSWPRALISPPIDGGRSFLSLLLNFADGLELDAAFFAPVFLIAGAVFLPVFFPELELVFFTALVPYYQKQDQIFLSQQEPCQKIIAQAI